MLDTQSIVHSLAEKNEGPINIIAHSFGGHIFHQLTSLCPDRIASCELIGTSYDIVAGFYKLMKTLSNNNETDALLKNKINSYLSVHTAPQATELWNYLALIAEDPMFLRLYWPSTGMFNLYLEHAVKAEKMDMLSFQNILNDFMLNFYNPSTAPSKWSGPIDITLGELDPLINLDQDKKKWTNIFPQARIKVLKNSGHFAHLESVLTL